MSRRESLKPQTSASRVERTLESIARLITSTPGTVITLGLFIFWLQLRTTSADFDLFARMAVGRLVVQTGGVPTVDPFAFTRTKPVWVDHEWLAGLIFYLMKSCFGDAGLVLLNFLFVFATSLLLMAARRAYLGRGRSELAAIVLMNMALHPLWGLTIRSLSFSYFGVALILAGALRYQRYGDRITIFLAALFTCLWVHAHAGFVVGLGLLLFYAIVSPTGVLSKKLYILTLLALVTASTFLSPYGVVEFWSFVGMAIFKARPSVPEWWPVAILSKEALWTVPWIAPPAMYLVSKRRVFDVAGAILLVGSAIEGFRSYRMMAFFYLIAFVYTSPYLEWCSDTCVRMGRRYLVATRAVALWWWGASIVFFCCGLTFLLRCSTFQLETSIYPVAAFDRLLDTRQGGNLLVHFDWGSYAMWRLYPRFKVSMDGRYEELYPDETVQQTIAALDPHSPVHSEALHAVNPDVIILKASEFKENAFDDYVIIHRDKDFLLLQRRTSAAQ